MSPLAEPREFEQYRQVLRDDVERSTLRAVASRLGMSPSGLQNFLDGTQPYGKTREKLRAWSYQEFGFESLPAADAIMLLRRLVGRVPAPERTILQILDLVGATYSAEGMQLPEWVGVVRSEVVRRA
jgi:hypothetical protein